MVTFLTLLLSSSSPLTFLPSFAHSVTEQAKIFRSSVVSASLWKIAASMRNGRRRTALHGVQYCCFLDHARSPAAVRRRTSAIRRRILLPTAAKVVSILREKQKVSLDLLLRKIPQRISQANYFKQPHVRTLTELCLMWRSWLVSQD